MEMTYNKPATFLSSHGEVFLGVMLGSIVGVVLYLTTSSSHVSQYLPIQAAPHARPVWQVAPRAWGTDTISAKPPAVSAPLGATTSPQGPTTLRKIMEDKLFETLSPVCCEVIDESGDHGSPPGTESHFKVVVVSDAFEGKRIVQRHKMVNAIFEDAFKVGLHALTITTKTPEEWTASGGVVPESPRCQGHG
jgi:BolA protein|uniref:BolA-like protein n=1 Tax=Eutreptiella gymnastica TaxID=73025 RepID=A0A7S4GGR1_9EUGL|mmetsp:Transcript_102/g.121  ORF Transcript_102/g.121 Transcript_102/m.121 type:complete len:192 (-) Transcript_102:513-1088(-)